MNITKACLNRIGNCGLKQRKLDVCEPSGPVKRSFSIIQSSGSLPIFQG